MKFTVIKKEEHARRAVFETVHGTVQTPCFMNVATSAAIKGGLSTRDLEAVGAQVMLCNTYHLHVRPGDELAVQIIQEAQKTKLPKVSPSWEIAGRYMVLTPGDPFKNHNCHNRNSQSRGNTCISDHKVNTCLSANPHSQMEEKRKTRPGVSFSRKLTQEQKTILRRLSSGWDTEGCNILFRTQSAEVTSDELEKELKELLETARTIRQKEATRSCFSVLYDAPGLQEQIIRRCRPGELKRFLTDDPGLARVVKGRCGCDANGENGSAERTGCPVELYEDPQLALFRLRSLTTLLDRLTAARVPMRSGGSLIIEQTEAFVVIDVNTARFTGRKDHEETIRRINLEAAGEAARQIRLRQLSGTILIDFINSHDPRDDAAIGEILETRFRQDPVSTRLIDFTKLHICEITRRKIHRSLQEQIAAVR